jgi:hypothetical protein
MATDRMSKTWVKKRRGVAEPRWCWSGVAPAVAPRLSRADMKQLLSLLPSRQTRIHRIAIELRQLSARYRRYLHQDEFGPSRAEQMAALRALGSRLEKLSSQLARPSRAPSLLLCTRLAQSAPPKILLDTDVDSFEASRNDKEAVQQILELMEAAETERCATITDAAEQTVHMLWALDSTTEGAILDAYNREPLNLREGDDSSVGIVRARVGRLFRCVQLAVARLESRGGPEPAINLRWLVWSLCDLYQRETGRRVTSSAVVDYRYEASPQSAAGRFVLACVKALQPTKAWLRQPEHSAPLRRALFFTKGALDRAVYVAMRDYVAHHRRTGPRRGRRQ